MKQTKRIAAVLLALMLVLGLLPLSAGAQDPLPDTFPTLKVPEVNPEGLKPLAADPVENPAILPPENTVFASTSGTCGDNLTWKYSGNDLTISGTGAMYDYSDTKTVPWSQYAGVIMNIIIEEGVTSIGDRAFMNFTRLIRVYIHAGLDRVGSRAFDGASWCTAYFLGDAPEFAADAFANFQCRPYYFREWNTSVLKNYGGEAEWMRGSIGLSSANRQLYDLNEEIRAEDLIFCAYAHINAPMDYTPGSIEIGQYDNSTLGEKTVQITADGTELTYHYYVSDGGSHLDLITVAYDQLYDWNNAAVYPKPVVTAGGEVLRESEHYTITYRSNDHVGVDASFTITGKGIYQGFEKTYPFAILRSDLAAADILVNDAEFCGMYMEPGLDVIMDDYYLTADTHYNVIYKDNVNVGTGSVRVIGRDGFCGSATANFRIRHGETSLRLNGVYNGSAYDDTITEDYYYEEGLMSPGLFTGRINSTAQHLAYYILYRIEGDEAVFVTDYESDYGYASDTVFTYDFSDVYNSTSPDGGEVYMLSYSWMDSSYDLYSGVCVMYIPAKVPGAASMIMEYIPDENDFRYEYLTVYGEDGVLENVTWTSSNEAIAAVSDGAVTFRKPGTVTITAKSGKLTASYDVTVSAQDLTEAVIFNYNTVNSTANVIYAEQLLQPGTDYVLTASTENDITTVTVTGCGLFEGQIVRQFDAVTGTPLGHTHTFGDGCDASCGSCEYTREAAHRYGAEWTKDMEGHWHACAVCGDKADYEEHALSPDDDTFCAVCGTLYIPGDLNQNFAVNEDDAIYLLQHILLPDFFPVTQAVDYTGDGLVNEDDAIYLLQHVLLPDFFPL